MQRNHVETLIGAIVLAVAASFITIVYQSGNVGTPSNAYHVQAHFDKADGLSVGSDVRISGLKVGTVTDLAIDPATYLAVATLALNKSLQIPKDSSAQITSEGLLGGRYLSLVPGAEERSLAEGDRIIHTQGAVNLEELIGKFAFGSAVEEEEDDLL